MMAEDSSNHDEGFGLPPAPTIAPEFAHEWLNAEQPESLSAIETVMLSRFNYLAAQNQHIMLQLENLHLTNSQTQSHRGSMSFTTASTEGGDDGSIAPISGARVQEALDHSVAGVDEKIAAVQEQIDGMKELMGQHERRLDQVAQEGGGHQLTFLGICFGVTAVIGAVMALARYPILSGI